MELTTSEACTRYRPGCGQCALSQLTDAWRVCCAPRSALTHSLTHLLNRMKVVIRREATHRAPPSNHDNRSAPSCCVTTSPACRVVSSVVLTTRVVFVCRRLNSNCSWLLSSRSPNALSLLLRSADAVHSQNWACFAAASFRVCLVALSASRPTQPLPGADGKGPGLLTWSGRGRPRRVWG